MSSDLTGRVRAVLDVDPEEFREQVERDAEVVKEGLRDGAFDNHQSIVGLEYEFYAVDDGRWAGEGSENTYSLMRVPRRLLELIGFEKELGLHNAEMQTSPQPFNPPGLRAQESEVLARMQAALDCTHAEGMRLVSDALWTIPPAGESARDYLTDSVVDDGIHVATNMSDATRYHAMANGPHEGIFSIDAPHVDLTAETVMPESLITSIQPHYQVSHAPDLPNFFNYAVRLAGPLLALGVNSPFFPADFYEEGVDPADILVEGWDENRIAVFESVLNTATEEDKVSLPRDVADVEEAVDRVVEDEIFVPMPVDQGGDRFDDAFATLRRKHGTYWRWVRPVFEGATRAAANARIEFRPIPAQPTVGDSIAFQAAFAGLMESLPQRQHPVIDQDWAVARENFYAAMREGLDADLRWITNDGQETTDPVAVYDDILAHAADGLKSAGCSPSEAERYVAPLQARVEMRRTPADWKRERVRDALADVADLSAAVGAMQREYVERQTETLLEGSFAEWA